ncbi:MAG: CbtA family protein [Haloplanus sp.]
MLTTYLKRGVKAGLLAGLAFGILVAVVANPLIGFADGFADHDHATGDGHSHDESVVSAAVTNGVSVVSGVLWGIFLGGVVFGIAYYFLEPAIPGTGGTKSYLLAAAGFVTVSGAPWLVLPPQPPGIEAALATETRLLLYGGMMVAGGLVSAASGVLYRRLRGSHSRVTATVAALLPVSLLAIPAALAPVPPAESALPPELAAGLTGLVVFGQALLWLLLAGTHARLHGRSEGATKTELAATAADESVAAD